MSRSRVRALERLITDEQITIAKAASVRLPGSLRQERYDSLVGVVFSGPGVDGVPALLALGPADLTPLPVDDLARRTFTEGQTQPTRSLERYRRTLAGSDNANDALICAAAA